MSPELSPQRRGFIRGWIIFIALSYLALGTLAISTVEGEKRTANRNHALRLDPSAAEPDKTAPEPFPANTDFTRVQVGIYLDGIDALSIKDSSWMGTFYIWFRWKGNKSLDPGKTFRLVDAGVEKKDLQDSYTGEDGTNYQCFKVVARITKFFNTTRVPLDDHMLNIYVEDARDASQLRYVADPSSNVSSRVKVPGYSITGFGHVVKPHTYKTAYGDPRAAEGKHATFSEYNFAVSIKRSGVAVYVKLFIGLFAGVLLAFGSFFIRPSDAGPRFGIPSAAYFGVMANTYLVYSMLPPSGQFGLADYVTGIALFTISLCVASSLMSGYFFLRRDEKEMSRRLDQASWISIGIAFLIVNVALPISAFS